MITDIRLQNFRSYQDASFEFEEGVNIIIGPNASGKTNLLEAILMIARGKSFRGKDQELLRHDSDWARVDADTPDTKRTLKIQSQPEKTLKTLTLDDKTYQRIPLSATVPVVLFEPGHLQFLVGSPELRREYLDTIIEQTDDTYAKTWSNYRRTLIQRNNLLKQQQRIAKDQLFVWDLRLSEFGAVIVRKRLALLESINKLASSTYSAIAGKESQVEIEYIPNISAEQYGSYMHKQLEARHELDKIRGFTSVGPHREDIKVFLNGFPQQHTASRGEIRTLLLTLKIIELQLLEAARGQKPLLLLDDVFSELDGARRKALTVHLEKYQTFITTTDADVAKRQFQRAHLLTTT
jgi:DNA replication and repair protein RecF